MKSADLASASALKLTDVLGGLGHNLEHVDSLHVISKLQSDPDWNTNTENVSKEILIAEQCLDEMIEAQATLDYAKFTKRMEQTVVDRFSEKDFLRSMRNIREDYGPYVSRQYLGKINNGHYSEPAGKYPNKRRHVWRGVFEKQQRFITMGIFFNAETPVIHGILFW